MFENAPMPPEHAARLRALVEECRPLLAAAGMTAVQRLLVERGTSVIQAILVTRELTRPDPLPLRDAVDLVTASRA
ncbi:hypothetical protein [Kitasatospora sp. NPDC088134]|uniref:hypothetical protein n=1 Tax=Kitasatospora sp. NPDC088134 TaxID=3364071 RepID=UPI003802D5F0